MVSYRVEIPDGVRVSGVTADGCPTAVLPGEYLVHQLPRKLSLADDLFRFVGADAIGRDVHVPLAAFRCLMNAGTPRAPALAESA